MKSYSSHKKSRIQPQLTHKIQSKLMISSISRQTIPSGMLSKYDPSRQEQLLQKQYNNKFMTDRKRTSSTKKRSTSKKSHQNLSRDKEKGNTVQPQRLFFEGQDYRQRYYDLHQTHLRDKERWISDADALMTVKQVIFDFLVLPNQTRGEQLIRILQNERARRVIGKYVQSNERVRRREEVLQQVISILQVERQQEVVQTLRARVERFRNLDECTFKILELQSMNKRMVIQFQQRLRKNRKEWQFQSQRDFDTVRDQVSQLRQGKVQAEGELDLQRQQYSLLVDDLRKILADEQQLPTLRLVSGLPEVAQLHKVIRNLSSQLRDIQVDAEQNMFKLLKSNEEMVKLQQLMGLIKDDMGKQLQDEENITQQNICQIRQLNHIIEQLEVDLQNVCREREEVKKLGEKAKLQLEDERKLIGTTLGLNQYSSARITLGIQELSREIKMSRQKIVELDQTIQQKDNRQSELSTQIQQLSRTNDELKQTSKTALYQKQQYKFLLNNLRDQVLQMKQQHQEQLARTVREKDQEIVRSNKDILQGYGHLKQQCQNTNTQFNRLRLTFEEHKVELLFLKGKEEQTAKLLREREEDVVRVNQQNERYRGYLKEIEASFKEVVALEEVSSKRVISLEAENEHFQRLLRAYQTKNQDLQNSNNQLTQTRNQLKTELQKCAGDVKDLREERVKLQSTNLQLRLMTINKQTEIHRLSEQLKNMDKQSKSYQLSNNKMTAELNSVTRKLVMLKLDFKKRHAERIKRLQGQIASLKEYCRVMRSMVEQQVKSLNLFMVGSVRELSSIFEHEKEQILSRQLEERLRLKELQCRQQGEVSRVEVKKEEKQLQAMREASKFKMLEDRSKQITQCEQQHLLQIDWLVTRQREEINQLKLSHSIVIQEINKVHAIQIIRLQSQGQQLAQQAEQRYKAIAQMRDLRLREEVVAKDKNRVEVIELQTRHQQLIKELEQHHKVKVVQLQTQWQTQIQEMKLEQETRKRKQSSDAVEPILNHKFMNQAYIQPQPVQSLDQFSELPSIVSERISSSNASQPHSETCKIILNEDNIAQTTQIGTSCYLIQPLHHSRLAQQINNIILRVKELSQQKKQLINSFGEMRIQLIQELQERVIELERGKDEEWRGEQALILQGSQDQPDKDGHEGDKMNYILQMLLDSDTEIPSLAYWQKIKVNFLSIRKKIFKKMGQLKLDISAIDHKEPLVPSPSSLNVSDNQFFKRFGSQPDQILDLRQFRDKQTNRSERLSSSNLVMETMRKENEELKQKILSQIEDRVQLEEKTYQLQMSLQEMEIKLVTLENQTSIKGLEYNFKRLLDYVLEDNSNLFEQTCRVLMKMLHFEKGDIQEYQEKLSHKRKKRKSGLISTLFKN